MTNLYGLPDAIYRAVKNDSYSPGDTPSYTATSLLKPPRQARLMKNHADEIEEDASDRIWSLLGSAVHMVLERAGGNEIKETRYYHKIDDDLVSAQIDNLCLEKKTLTDFKVTTGWKFKGNKPPDPDFTIQLNIQGWLLKKNGISVEKLNIVGILRDWSKLEAQRDREYPQAQVVIQAIPMWSDEQIEAWLRMRIAAHKASKESLPDCTPEEMWEKPTSYAVVKRGNSRAYKVFYNYDAAVGLAVKLGEMYAVETRIGERTRCANYCSVNKFCSQYQTYKESRNENAKTAGNGE